MRTGSRPVWLNNLLLAVAYVATAKLGLSLATVHPAISAVWPPAGIALAALLLGGYRLLPGVWAGAFVSSASINSPAVSIGIATGNTLEALLAAVLCQQLIGPRLRLAQPAEVVRFVVLSLGAGLVGASVGVPSLALGGTPWPRFDLLWLTWWLGDATGLVVCTPLILSWASLSWPPRPRRLYVLEAGALFVGLLLTSGFAYGPLNAKQYSLAYLTTPFILWATLRFGKIGATSAVFLDVALADWGTWRGYGTFATAGDVLSLLVLQNFAIVTALVFLILAAVLEQRAGVEEALRRSNVWLEAAREGSVDGILMVDEQRRVKDFNQQFQRIWGIPPEVIGSLNDELLLAYVRPHLCDWERFIARVHALYEHPMEESREELQLVDGRTLDRHSAPAIARDGRVLGRIWYFRDVTEAKRLASALRTQNEQLTKLDALKTNFVNVVSHELRTPLTSLIGFAEFLEDELGGPLTAQQSDYVSQIQENAQRLKRLVDDLLDFSRLQAGTLLLRLGPASMSEVVNRALHTLLPQARAARITLEAEMPEGATSAVLDAPRIEQAVLNLGANALKFTPAGGRVTLRLAREGDGYRFSVHDTGIGIAPEHMAHLFERFYQVDPTTTRTTGGVGLGLAITKAIVEAHHGRIGAESTPGQGSTFWFSLPASPPEPPT